MDTISVKAHFDGQQIVLDEDVHLPTQVANGNDLATAALNRSFSQDEPKYDLADLLP